MSIADLVRRVVREFAVVDVHTHLFDPAQATTAGDGLLLTGIDELLTYHYHVAELFRARPDLSAAEFWALPKPAQADLVWRELFVERSPLSEVGCGIVSVLQQLGLESRPTDLGSVRRELAGWSPRELVDRVFAMARVQRVYMTNDPLDAAERQTWLDGFERDPRFLAALRLDSALLDWPAAVPTLRALGYDLSADLSESTLIELRRYLREWVTRLDARYMAVSLPPRLDYPGGGQTWMELLTRVALPTAVELGLPVALMIGVRRQVNPALGLAGDSLGTTDVESLERLAADFPALRLPVTLLAREGQHALCVAARKFANLRPFGCWWFVNNPTLAAEITSMRLDLLGPTFVAQHSDARVLEQMLFKWQRSREWLSAVLVERYQDLAERGWQVSAAEVERDVTALVGTGF